ncbi:hypothetical protein [Stenotrophomonas sp. YIM B06876]|uniref:hypothetical protein n=1 Tax=Stenotrophomonas sp. YIM B06876 TaxID=3060211 RepID=UPI00273870FE|nr:hypothetical protein [Stenotrophomonas sp. YIM B06876]
MHMIIRWFGPRWSLQVIHGNEVLYIVKQNSVIRLASLVSNLFLEYGNPRSPWRLRLNFNRSNSGFDLQQHHYINEEWNFSEDLKQMLKSIDSNYGQIRGADPVALDAKTKKQIPLFSYRSAEDFISPRSANRVTLSSVLSGIFGDDE